MIWDLKNDGPYVKNVFLNLLMKIHLLLIYLQASTEAQFTQSHQIAARVQKLESPRHFSLRGQVCSLHTCCVYDWAVSNQFLQWSTRLHMYLTREEMTHWDFGVCFRLNFRRFWNCLGIFHSLTLLHHPQAVKVTHKLLPCCNLFVWPISVSPPIWVTCCLI